MDIAQGEMVEKELDAMIERRARKGEADPDEQEELWKQSVRAYTARRREEASRPLEGGSLGPDSPPRGASREVQRPTEGSMMSTDPVEILNRRNAEVAKIRGYADLTEDAKERRIAEVSERAREEYAEAREAAERELHERAQKAEKALFETPYPYAASDVEQAQIRALRRGAYDGVYNSLSPLEPGEAREELDRLLRRAERTGDTELADAVHHVATERGVREVADAYLEKRPNQKRRWEEFVAAQAEVSE